MDKREAMLELVEIILDLVEASTKPFGMPGGELYAILMPTGMNAQQFEAIMGALCTVGQLKKAHQCYTPGPHFKHQLK
jgi:hypothetical protein